MKSENTWEGCLFLTPGSLVTCLTNGVNGFPQLELFKCWYTFPHFFMENLNLLASFPYEKLIKQCYCYKYRELCHGAPTDQIGMPTRGASLHVDRNWRWFFQQDIKSSNNNTHDGVHVVKIFYSGLLGALHNISVRSQVSGRIFLKFHVLSFCHI
jgi:hypothetical protein